MPTTSTSQRAPSTESPECVSIAQNLLLGAAPVTPRHAGGDVIGAGNDDVRVGASAEKPFGPSSAARSTGNKYDHFALRSLLQSLGISLRSATEPIDDTSTGKLMEGVLAAFAQFDNDCRSDRTRAGMKAALELGRWVFLAPIGYLNAPRAMGKSLMADPERVPLIRRAFEEYATGRFTKQQLLKQARSWGLTNRRGKRSRRRRSASCCATRSTQAS